MISIDDSFKYRGYKDCDQTPSTDGTFARSINSLESEPNIVGFYLVTNEPMSRKQTSTRKDELWIAAQDIMDEIQLKQPQVTNKTTDALASPPISTASECELKHHLDRNEITEGCPDIEVCLGADVDVDPSAVLLVHSIPSTAASDDRDKKERHAHSTKKSRTALTSSGSPQLLHTFSADGVELISSELADCDPLRIQDTKTRSFLNRLTVFPRRGQSLNVIHAISTDENQVDAESIDVSSLFSSVSDADSSLSSRSGIFSSGSGLVEEDLIASFNDDGGYPVNVYCFAFVDKLDERNILCLGDDEVY